MRCRHAASYFLLAELSGNFYSDRLNTITFLSVSDVLEHSVDYIRLLLALLF